MNFDPTSRLPRIRSQPDIPTLVESLELLSKIYAPSLRFRFSSFQEEPLREDGDGEDDADLSEEEEMIQMVRSDETERRFAKNWLTMLIGSGLEWIRDENQDDDDEEEEEEATLQSRTSSQSTIPGTEKVWDSSSIIDLAGNILASEAKVEESKEGLERTFTFPLSPSPFPPELYESLRPNVNVSDSRTEPLSESSGCSRMGSRESPSIALTLLDLPLPPSGSSSSEERRSIPASMPSSSEVHQVMSDSDSASASAASAVGLQTWAASIVLSDLLVRNPIWLHSDLYISKSEREPLKITELGAGTGLVGLVAALHLGKINAKEGEEAVEEKDQDVVLLTDYHPTVLDHLRSNVDNVIGDPSSNHSQVRVEKLDWEEVDSGLNTKDSILNQSWIQGKGDSDLILAADVIYSPTHASWLHSTILCTLKMDLEEAFDGDGDGQERVRWSKSRAHVLCAKRERGRFGEWALIEGVDKVFGQAHKLGESLDLTIGRGHSPGLKVIERRELPKVKGLGRQDESGWVWWQLAWVCVGG